MNKAQSIPPKDMPFAPDAPKHLDYDFLREEGLKHIQELSGQLWTDHNTHDPGITILEVLCYALTDLAYRMQLPDADIFAPNPQKRTATGDDNFPTAYTMLSCNPLTEMDWRKLLIDIKGVRNAWLVPIETKKKKLPDFTDLEAKTGELFDAGTRLWTNELWQTENRVYLDKAKNELTFTRPDSVQNDVKNYPLSIRGVYKIRLELEQNVEDKEPILAEVRRRLAGHRNLCEDFGDISIVQDEPLTLCGEFELDATAQPETVMLDIFDRIQEFFSPTIPFYTLRQMLDKGLTMEEIFEGRPFSSESHGFVNTAELEALQLPTEIRISDIYHLILGDDLTINPNGLKPIAGVLAIKKLLVINPKKQGQPWRVPITEGSRPTLNVAASIVGLTFFKRGVPYRVNAARVANLFEKRLTNPTKVIYKLKEEQEKGKQNLDAIVPTGEYREDLGEYFSIQEEFPVVYGIGRSTVPDSAGEKRKAQVAQLKGYLTFFDHILANYLAEIANIRTVFSHKLSLDNLSLLSGDAAQKTWLGKSPDAFAPLAAVADLRKTIPNPESLFGFAYEPDLVQIETSASPKTKPLFPKGKIIAKSPSTYPNPHDRDRALRQLIADIDANLVDIETEIFKKTGEDDRFYFVFSSVLGRKVTIRSLDTYETIAEAKAAAQEVRFVATLESSFDKIDFPAAKTPYYSFQLVYRPPQYKTYLRTISEDEATFFKQKNRLFDHLLSRFAEDFTDYTLLTFATLRNAGQQMGIENEGALSRQFALDKARFLEKYPEISRNRAKAMDFTQPLWTDANQSGLENRVSKLIGIGERGTKTLNYFDIESRPTRYRFLISDIHNRPLMRSSLTFKDDSEAANARLKCLDLGKNQARFQRIYCSVEEVYSFTLLDDNGCTVAESVDTFGSADLCDTKLRYVQDIFGGNGLAREFRSKTQGLFFEIGDNLGGQFRVEVSAKDKKTAIHNLVACLQAMPVRSNWQPVDDETQQQFSFKIIDSQVVTAVYGVFFKTKKERDTRLKAVFDYFKHKKQLWQTQQHPTRYRWQLAGTDHKTLLTSRHYFSSPKQAAAAWLEAKKAVTDADFGTLSPVRVGDKFGIELLRFSKDEEGRHIEGEFVILAQATFHKAENRDAALRNILKLTHAIEGDIAANSPIFWQSQTTKQGAARLNTEGGKFSLNLQLNRHEDQEGLFGDTLFDNKNDALSATFAILPNDETDTSGDVEEVSTVVNVAELADNYTFFADNNGCVVSFNIKNEETVLASFEPYQLSSDEAIAKRKGIVNAAIDQKLDIKLKTVVNQRWFEVMDETCDEHIVPILRGYKKSLNIKDLELHFDDFIAKIKSDLLVCTVKGSAQPFQFEIKDWAISVKSFKTKEEAEIAAATFTQWVKTDFKAIAGQGEVMTLEDKCADETLFPTYISDPNRWRLSDADNAVARFVGRVFGDAPNLQDMDSVKEKLIADYACQPPLYSMVYENIDNFGSDIKGNYWYVLRDARQAYWRSSPRYEYDIPDFFGSANEALAAFDAQYIELLTLAREIRHYRIRSRKVKEETIFYIELQGLDGKPLAESVVTATDTEGVNDLMARLHQHALLFPILKNADGRFSFQIYDDKAQAVVWQSLHTYEKQTEAKMAFSQFLDLLTYRGHYRLVTTEDGCKTYIELIEVLLEEVSTQKIKDEKHAEIDDCNWLNIEYFIDDLVAAGDAAFVPTVDYQNGCSYGFKLARTNYRLARHAASFHAKTTREMRRDELWHIARCRKKMELRDTEGSAIGQIMSCIDGGFFRELMKSENTDFLYFHLTLYDNIDVSNKPPAKLVYEYDHIFNKSDAPKQVPTDPDKADETEVLNFKTQRQAALNEARSAMPNYNSWLVLTEADGTLRLGITRADGTLIIVFDEWVAENGAAMKHELEQFYAFINFSSEVIALPDGTFGFEIREKTVDKEFVYVNGLVDAHYDSIPVELPVFKVIWRNIQPYQSANEAQAAADKVHNLLTDKANYARTNAADGSPTLEIVDPTKIVAVHPRTYTTTSERDAAWQNVRQHIHTEGMHLVEHLLLRPRFGENELSEDDKKDLLLPSYLIRNEEDKEPEIEIKGFDPTDDDDSFDDYIMGADPYSFWLTVVLPHWSARFRDLDFRDFFEGTLRREAPAHIGLNIVWVTPSEMQKFEKVWRKWLEVADDPTHNLYNCRKKCLLDVFKNLKSITPEAGLLDCSTGASSKLIILDKTTLR